MSLRVLVRAGATRLAPTASPATDIDLWLVDLLAGGDELARAESSLTPRELARARRGTPAAHRRRVLLRAALRSALGVELGTDARRVPIRTTLAGRPHLPGSGLDVSCSASGALGVVALGRGRRVGVDVESVAPWTDDALDEGWLDSDERRSLVRLPLDARAEAAARAWTQKEAVLKARGTGLLDNPSTVGTTVGRKDGVVAGWEIRDVPLPHGWVASLAVAPEKGLPS